MKDASDARRDRDWDEYDRLDDRIYRQAFADRNVKADMERLRQQGREQPERGARPEDRLNRLHRLRARDAAAHPTDVNPERARRAEDVEIRANPEGYLRKHADEGLDPATEREIRKALAERDARRRRRW
jgi:hypothetical protein